ncbi:lysozyme inhibitor LprI family protein [Sphingomonas floccifaciens]|uniref:Lysozyme inhibitor LprI family protein n=1 Tax=Sphingomonas floccifaciens TaxID=1844115 RepID=A0ABW4NGL2_9SPHN
MIRTLALAVPALIALSGCGPLSPVGCSNDIAQSTLVSVIRDAVEAGIADELREAGGGRAISRSSIRAALADVVIKLDDIRTAKEDPNSSRRFCTATLAMRFPGDTVADADAARRAVGETSVADLAANNDVERAADRYSADIEFNVQPTDDGEKVFAETDRGTAMIQFAKEVVGASLLRSKLETAKRAADQAVADQTAAETAALTEQRTAALESAKVDNQLAWQTIRATWGTLDKATRTQLQPVQTAWTRKTDADCRVEAAAAAIDPSEREAAHLSCSTRMVQERIRWLNGMRRDDPTATTTQAVAVREPVPTPADDL